MDSFDFNIISEPQSLDEIKFNQLFESIKPLYANHELTKCIVEDENYFFTKCAFTILDHLVDQPKLKSPYIRLFFKTIESFHKTSVCSTKTAILLSIVLLRKCNSTRKLNDLDPQRLSDSLKKIFEEIIDLAKQRYSLSPKKKMDEAFILSICRNDCKSSSVINEILKKIFKFNLRFANKSINFCVTSRKNGQNLIENSFNFRVKKGFYFRIDESQSFLFMSSQKVNALVFDSNLSPNFVHLGFNKKIKIEKFYTGIKNDDYDFEWYEKITHILKENKIQVLILKESLESRLAKFCNINSILILKNFSRINNFKKYSISYISEFNSSKILEISLEFLKKESKNKEKSLNCSYVKVKFSSLDNFITLIIENRFKNTEMMMLDYLKHSLHRLENVINDGYFLGGGITEKKMVEDIENLKNNENDLFFEYARDILKESLLEMIYLKERIIKSKKPLIDDVTSKIKAWETALFINRFFLNCDSSIIV